MVRKNVLLKSFFVASMVMGAEAHAGEDDTQLKLFQCKGLPKNIQTQCKDMYDKYRVQTTKAKILKAKSKADSQKRAQKNYDYLVKTLLDR